MASKKYDLVVKVGEYTKNGETKNRYQNVGAVIEGNDGGKFITLNRYFNPAGIPNPDDRDNVILSMFEPRQDQGQGQTSQGGGGNAADDEEDIPF